MHFPTHPQRRRRALAAVAVLTSLALLTGAGCSKKKKEAVPAASSTTAPSTTKPDPTVPDTAVRAPLTGLPLADPVVAFRPALAVKVDNLDGTSSNGRPQAGLNDADVVFEEIVEGGITRLVPVFQSGIPARVGPVRSARTTDPILLAQLNRPLFAWSGGNGYVVGAVRNGPLRDFGWDALPPAYSRDSSRRAPHNLFVVPGTIYDAAPKDTQPPHQLFTYRKTGDRVPASAAVAKGVRLDFGGVASVPVTYEYDAKADTWKRNQNGTPHVDDKGVQVAPANVVIMFMDYAPSPADSRSPEAQSTGKGEVWVLTKGRVVKGTWYRPDPDKPASLTDASGDPIKLTPGKTWIELPKPGQGTLQ